MPENMEQELLRYSVAAHALMDLVQSSKPPCNKRSGDFPLQPMKRSVNAQATRMALPTTPAVAMLSLPPSSQAMMSSPEASEMVVEALEVDQPIHEPTVSVPADAPFADEAALDAHPPYVRTESMDDEPPSLVLDISVSSDDASVSGTGEDITRLVGTLPDNNMPRKEWTDEEDARILQVREGQWRGSGTESCGVVYHVHHVR